MAKINYGPYQSASQAIAHVARMLEAAEKALKEEAPKEEAPLLEKVMAGPEGTTAPSSRFATRRGST